MNLQLFLTIGSVLAIAICTSYFKNKRDKEWKEVMKAYTILYNSRTCLLRANTILDNFERVQSLSNYTKQELIDITTRSRITSFAMAACAEIILKNQIKKSWGWPMFGPNVAIQREEVNAFKGILTVTYGESGNEKYIDLDDEEFSDLLNILVNIK